MRGHKIVKDFKYKGRRCVVIEIDRGGEPNLAREFLEGNIGQAFKPYCNGYIELKKDEIKEDYDNYNIKSDEITYQGELKFAGELDCSDGKTYLGFDSAHFWNWEKPESTKAEYVAKTCKKIVDELIKKRK